ncbi:hypothetical protein HPG69_018974, partial [Diceros bicornis minor]
MLRVNPLCSSSQQERPICSPHPECPMTPRDAHETSPGCLGVAKPMTRLSSAKGRDVHELVLDQETLDQSREPSGVSVLGLAEAIWCSPCVPA